MLSNVARFIACEDLWSQSKPTERSDSRGALQATLVGQKMDDVDGPTEMLIFHLANHSHANADSESRTWKLVIDDKDVVDSGMIFGNGPGPIGGYGTLQPGSSYDFGKNLPLVRYFPEDRQYKVCWRGSHFRSDVIIVHGLAKPR
jgi:hypothetical protein